VRGSFDETVFRRVAAHPQVAYASPVVEATTYAVMANGERRALRVVGIDALVVAAVAPSLMPLPAADADRFAIFSPGAVFLNPAAQALLGDAPLKLQSGLALAPVTVAGRTSAGGGPLAVMDIGAAQDLFQRAGLLSRIDVRLRAGVDHAAFIASLKLPPDITAAEPGDAAQRVSNLSRAYRVNLTVLALVALFTGAFLVFSVLSLSVAKRAQQFALLGVLGLTARQRLQLVLWESLVIGLVGSAAGVALGSVLAALALQLLGGDLGGGYFAGVAPALQWDGWAALIYGALGVAAALVGGWWPARSVQSLPLAQTLKGLGAAPSGGRNGRLSLGLMVAGALLALTPPVFGIPLAAYVSVALLLVGGITALPWLIGLLYDVLSPLVARQLLPLLAVERARRVRESAAVAVSGVVASLSLAVALTVMVASFRDSVTHWLDVVLPAQLYVRTAGTVGSSDTAYFSPEFVQNVARVPGVKRMGVQRFSTLLLDAGRPPVALLARGIAEPAKDFPLVGNAVPAPAGSIAIYVSEPMVDLYGAMPAGGFFVAGIWRDYSRQTGAIAMDQRDFARLTGDERVNDLALWLDDGTEDATVRQAISTLALRQSGSDGLVEFSSAGQIRAISLKIFDRSFAVTYWLQAVAIAIGLFGVAASFSAQVLARRKEFGLLAHLGLTRRQVLTVVAGEGAAWTFIGSIAGLLLGFAVSVVLIHVVNPQSFHWTMDLLVPWLRLFALCAAVVLAGTVTAWLAGRAAARQDAVLAVKEDW
jgi:putative ABC transport system permease protein